MRIKERQCLFQSSRSWAKLWCYPVGDAELQSEKPRFQPQRAATPRRNFSETRDSRNHSVAERGEGYSSDGRNPVLAIMQRPTVADITGDNQYAQLARQTWLTSKPSKVLPDVIQNELWQPLQDEDFSYASLLLLEQLQCLERYLWPGYTEDASNQHALLMVLLVNTKRRERLPVWHLFSEDGARFSSFFRRVLQMSIEGGVTIPLRTHVLQFIAGAFQSLDTGIVRKECAPLVSIGIWQKLHSDLTRERHLAKSAQLQKAWRASNKRFDQADAETQARLRFERNWLYILVLDFLERLYDEEAGASQREQNMRFCEAVMELLCDLQSQLPTRRYVNALLQDLNVLPAIRLSPMYQDEDSGLLREQQRLLSHYTYAAMIDDQSGRQLTAKEFDDAEDNNVSRLQKVAMMLLPEKLKILYLSNAGALKQRGELAGHLEALTDDELTQLATELGIRTAYPEKPELAIITDRQFILECFLNAFEHKESYTSDLEALRTLPTEHTLYEQSILRTDDFDGTRPLAIPKLNLQYLSLGDFVYRSYVLHRSEAFYEIRKHVEDTLKRLQPRTGGGQLRWDGFSKMAIPIPKPAVIEVTPARVGENVPAEVRSEVMLDVSRLQPGLRREWESLRPDDVVFLIAVQPPETERRLTNGNAAVFRSANEEAGIKALRCAEVISVLDENGRVLRHDQDAQAHVDSLSRPRQRRLILRLDAASYKADKERADAGKGDVLDSINLIVRRRARENNFKAVLESIKQLALSEAPIPSWFSDVFLGYGDPASATYKRLPNRLAKVDYRDTFLDWQHLVESLPGKTVEPDPTVDASFPPPYVLEATSTSAPAPPAPKAGKKRRRDQPDGPDPAPPATEAYQVSTYEPPNNGPYPTDAPKTNTVRFTPAQIEAITSGSQPGLTLIVGPPGTGKTDVATQIISNVYHNHPEQRTLLIAHSNQALNQLFQKIAALDIDERHLLRLGHGEEELAGLAGASFSKAGRVESFLERGSVLLAEVQRLAESIGAPGAHGSSCETAEYFDQVWVRPRWKRFWQDVEAGHDVAERFPFQDSFADAPQPLFGSGSDKEGDVEIAKGCERHVKRIFDELADIRPFEILRREKDKSNYLLIKEARVVAMTSTHAAMRRQEIASLGFRYDNVVVEEAAQMTEVDNFIPLALQEVRKDKDGKPQGGLQRVVLVGDHLQNSPVVQNAAFRQYANMEQSLFLRLIRLGVPHILLDAQGRARPSLAALYKWRYPQLTNLPFTAAAPEFVRANAGFRYDYQFIDVADYKGQGETEPSPHFIQNLGEAEYAVALYQYLRLLGYPAEKISILCTYAGQRALVRDVLTHRCKNNRLFGMPAWVGTVDKYQGEQNDYVILSLVRTKTPGFMRDIRRLTVALSRARLGLYVLGRREVFETSLELREAFGLLFERSNRLEIVTGEMFPAERRVEAEAESTKMEGVEHLGQYVYQMTQAKVKALKEAGGTLPPPAQTNGRVEDEDDEADEPAGNGEETVEDIEEAL